MLRLVAVTRNGQKSLLLPTIWVFFGRIEEAQLAKGLRL